MPASRATGRAAPTSRTAVLVLACAAAGAAMPSCAERGPTLPQDVLADVLTDLHLSDARADAFSDPTVRDSVRRASRADALARHGLDSLAWSAALDALAGTPERLSTAYDTVLARLAQEPSALPRATDLADPSPSVAVPASPFQKPPFSPRP